MAGVNFSLNSDGGVVVQQQTSGGGSSTTFSGGGSDTPSQTNIGQGGFNSADIASMGRTAFSGIDTLNKLTQGLIQPYIDRAKKEQYAEGMSQAAQGKSLIQIQNDQPWYTQIFGPDATVQGAQMYNVNAAMNDAQTQFMQAMPQLREKSPDQVRAYVVGKMADVPATGDQYTDAMIQQKLAEQLPQMLSQHMQQYVQYTQEQNYKSFTNMGTSAAKAMQATLQANPAPTDDDIASAHAAYNANLVKPDGMTQESYDRALKDITLSNAMNGNWQGVRAVQQTPGWAQMDPLQKAELTDKIPLLEAQAASKNPAYAQDLTSAEALQFNMTKGVSPYASTEAGHAAAITAMTDINSAYAQKYGDATAPFPPSKQRAVLEQMDMNNQRQYLSGLKAQQKQLNFDQAQTLVSNAWTGNAPESLKGIPIPEGAQVQQLNAMYDHTVQQDPNSPDAQSFWAHASANAHDSDFIVPKLKGMIQSTTGTMFDGNGPATSQQMALVQDARLLRNGPGGVDAVKAYYGDHAEAMLAILDSNADLTDPEQFNAIRAQWQRGRLAAATTQDKKDALDYVQRQDTAWWNPFRKGDLAGWDISDGNKANLAQQVAPLMAQKMRAFGLSQDDAARAAYQQVLGGSTLVPGALVPNDAGKWGKGQTWSDYVGQVPGAVSSQNSALYQNTMRSYINDLATDAVKATGKADMSNFDPKDYNVQWGTYLGNGLMSLNLTKGDGSPLMVVMKAGEFGSRIADAVKSHAYGADGNKFEPKANAYGWAY
jgi:hypothetical protein